MDWGGRADIDDHSEFVGLMKRHFTPQRVLDYRPQVEHIMNSLLEVAISRGRFDVANDVAHPLAMSVVCVLTGIPSDEMDMLLRVELHLWTAGDGGAGATAR